VEQNHPPAGTELLPAGAGRPRLSTHGKQAWRRLLAVALCCVAAAGSQQLWHSLTPLSTWVTVLLLAGAGTAAARFLLIESWGRRFWIVWLSAGTLMLLASGRRAAGLYLAVTFYGLFLLLRRYRPYRHIGSRHRAAAFFLGLLSLAMLIVGWVFPPDSESLSTFHLLGVHASKALLATLQVFWILSLFHLVAGMRLHFLRLRAKLAVSAFLVAVVPLVLVVLLLLLALYGALGGRSAAEARAILQEWQTLVAAGADPQVMGLQAYFSARVDPQGEQVVGEAPAWLPELLAQLKAPRTPSPAPAEGATAERPAGASEQQRTGDGRLRVTVGESEEPPPIVWIPVDTTAYFHIGEQMWLLDLHGVGGPALRVTGHEVGQQALDRLSRLLGADVGVYSSPGLSIGDDVPRAARGALDLRGQRRRPMAAADTSGSLWDRPLGFGAAVLGTIRLTPEDLYRSSVLLHLRVRLAKLAEDFVTGENEFNQAVVAALAVVAGMFLLLQIFALFFGLRITTGITSAVQALHRGTERLAAGDLQTRIEIPNEDEFGDLALSFNQMIAAIRHGQQETIARERLERELEMAREIQERLLPHEAPPFPGYELTGMSLPSRQVGGDYFDFLDLGDGRLGLAIGDVSGKGIPAALLMANLQASLQGQVVHPSSVAEVVARMNELLVRSTDPRMFATFFYAELDGASGRLTYTNAGHNPPLLCRRDGSLSSLGEGGLLLGMLSGQAYEQQSVVLAPGEFLVLYTDGITEAAAPVPEEEEPGDMFGEEALRAVIREHADRPAAGVREAILAAVERHTRGAPQSDDITLMVVRRRSRPSAGHSPAGREPEHGSATCP
jgi:serine phosphatase RsbU (regulator of sigma subunit)